MKDKLPMKLFKVSVWRKIYNDFDSQEDLMITCYTHAKSRRQAISFIKHRYKFYGYDLGSSAVTYEFYASEEEYERRTN